MQRIQTIGLVSRPIRQCKGKSAGQHQPRRPAGSSKRPEHRHILRLHPVPSVRQRVLQDPLHIVEQQQRLVFLPGPLARAPQHLAQHILQQSRIGPKCLPLWRDQWSGRRTSVGDRIDDALRVVTLVDHCQLQFRRPVRSAAPPGSTSRDVPFRGSAARHATPRAASLHRTPQADECLSACHRLTLPTHIHHLLVAVITFNELPPPGVAHQPAAAGRAAMSTCLAWFRSTPPHGGRLRQPGRHLPLVEVSIHAPAWRATRGAGRARSGSSCFDPRPRMEGDR